VRPLLSRGIFDKETRWKAVAVALVLGAGKSDPNGCAHPGRLSMNEQSWLVGTMTHKRARLQTAMPMA